MADRAPVTFQKFTSALPSVRAVGRYASPLEDLYHFVMTRPWWQFFAMGALSFVLLNAIFALALWLRPGCIEHAHTYEDLFFFSVQTLGTIGYGGMSPATRYGHVIVTIEALVGIFSTALITGMTFARFARPHAKVLFARKCTVTRRDGVPHLMFRMANWRHNNILEAQLRVMVLVVDRTREGQEMRVPIEVPLVRDRTQQFGLTWLAMHKIDDKSLFAGGKDVALARLREKKAAIFLTLSGIDDTLGQTVTSRWAYELDDIVWDAVFEDVMTITDDGERVLDYTRFHDTKPQPPESVTAVS